MATRHVLAIDRRWMVSTFRPFHYHDSGDAYLPPHASKLRVGRQLNGVVHDGFSLPAVLA